MKTIRTPKGFTLLELIVVVLFIVIIMAIVVPDFCFNSDKRAKVSRVRSDMRALATAIEAYYVDNHEYPPMANGLDGANREARTKSGAFKICTFQVADYGYGSLTTPMQYITSHFPDPFADSRGTAFGYRKYDTLWILLSYGPDRDENAENPGDIYNTICSTNIIESTDGTIIDLNFEPVFDLSLRQPSPEYLAGTGIRSQSALTYDPTNGAKSNGDIYRMKQK